VFTADADAVVNGTELTVTWLVHLLVLSMLQHPNGEFTWGRFVLVHPESNTDYAELAARYGSVVADPSSYASITIEALLGSGALPAASVLALRDRYVVR
jgi:hypothetical protein